MGVSTPSFVRFVQKADAERCGVKFEKTAIPGIVCVRGQETWADLYIGEWIVAARIVIQDGQPVIGELRIIPERYPLLPPAESEAVLKGNEGRAPIGGLTRRFLRSIPLGDIQRQLGDVRKALGKNVESMPGFIADAFRHLTSPNQPGPRGGRPVVFYAQIAKDYSDLLESGESRPIAVIAKKRQMARSQVRDAIHKARELNLLTTFVPGRPGGELTPEARALLQSKKGKSRGRQGKAKR